MESPVPDVTVDEPFDLLRNPYPMFAERRRESAGIFEGSVMDWSKAADMRPKDMYAAVSFDAVNQVFRDGQAFNSRIYDSTIGLFIGPTMLAMEGRTHWEHRNLVSAAFKSQVVATLGARDRAPRGQCADRRVHRRTDRPTWSSSSPSSSPPGSSPSCSVCPRTTCRGFASAPSS